jgi:hypothetical protein
MKQSLKLSVSQNDVGKTLLYVGVNAAIPQYQVYQASLYKVTRF